MTDAQVLFRLDRKMLKRLDKAIEDSGYATRNEWFRDICREWLEKHGAPELPGGREEGEPGHEAEGAPV